MCLSPLTTKNRYTDETCTFPCSKCPECRARRASAWSFRLMQQEKTSISSYFVTLTYDTLTVPITKTKRTTLCKRDVQLFFKKLRKAQRKANIDRSIKYYLCGEYGERTQRPHYHIILFDANIETMVNVNDHLKLKYSNFDGKTEIHIKQWDKGHATIGQVTPASVGYTLKYISKPKTVPMYKGDDRLPQFSLMSKRLGFNYLTDEMIKWHTSDIKNRMYCVMLDGIKLSMPRYYKDKIYNSIQREQIKQHFYDKYVEGIIEKFHSPTYQDDYRDYKEAVQAAHRWNKLTTKKETL